MPSETCIWQISNINCTVALNDTLIVVIKGKTKIWCILYFIVADIMFKQYSSQHYVQEAFNLYKT